MEWNQQQSHFLRPLKSSHRKMVDFLHFFSCFSHCSQSVLPAISHSFSEIYADCISSKKMHWKQFISWKIYFTAVATEIEEEILL